VARRSSFLEDYCASRHQQQQLSHVSAAAGPARTGRAWQHRLAIERAAVVVGAAAGAQGDEDEVVDDDDEAPSPGKPVTSLTGCAQSPSESSHIMHPAKLASDGPVVDAVLAHNAPGYSGPAFGGIPASGRPVAPVGGAPGAARGPGANGGAPQHAGNQGGRGVTATRARAGTQSGEDPPLGATASASWVLSGWGDGPSVVSLTLFGFCSD
jgi:hypothetical protein